METGKRMSSWGKYNVFIRAALNISEIRIQPCILRAFPSHRNSNTIFIKCPKVLQILISQFLINKNL
jgi:hypothetical protein